MPGAKHGHGSSFEFPGDTHMSSLNVENQYFCVKLCKKII